MKRFLLPLVCLLTALTACAAPHRAEEDKLRAYIADKDAHIGIAVMTAEVELFGVNMHDSLPMLSVMKFPLSLAVADYVRRHGGTLSDTIFVDRRLLRSGTHSPMLERYPNTRDHHIPIDTLIRYAMQVSDNNACDVLMDYIGGASVADRYVKSLGIEGISIRWNEYEMNSDIRLCRENTSTPAAMARLLHLFDTQFHDPASERIREIMETCATGTDRLSKPFAGTGAVVGHKTGTGPTDPATGRIVAVNDAGYVHLPDGSRFVIAVFVSDSGYDMDATASLLAGAASLLGVQLPSCAETQSG